MADDEDKTADDPDAEDASEVEDSEAEAPADDASEQDPFDDDALFDLVSDATDESEDVESSDAPDDAAGKSEAPEATSDGSEKRTLSDAESTASTEDEETAPADESDTVKTGAPDPNDFEDLEGETLSGSSTTDSEPEEVEPDPGESVIVADDESISEDSGEGGESAPADPHGDREPLLSVEGLKTYFYTKEGEVPAVDGVDFDLHRGETLGLVGESGSGKSVSALSILRLVPDPPGKIVDGEIRFQGRDLTQISEKEMRSIRGNDISMIFQEPMTSLNPVYTVGNQIVEAITLHQDVEYAEAREMAISMLEKVGIPAPRERIDEYPHQMSGGMKQRVMIAMALACNPKLLIADEPTTALDVTIQAQILDLLQELQDEMDMSVLFITHDLGVVAETCDYVAVMYGGRVVEYGDVETIFENPSHPYTLGLLSSLPQVDMEHQRRRKDRLYVIPGMVPSPQNFPSGCRFRDRCDYATEKCAELPEPQYLEEPGHESLCWFARGVREGTKEKTGPVPEEGSETVEAAE